MSIEQKGNSMIHHNEEKHTPGLLYINRDRRPDMEWNNHLSSVDAPHLTICFMAHDGTPDNERGEANARRLTACWNFLDGVPTAELEKSPSVRDEFLASMRSVRDLMESLTNDMESRSAIGIPYKDLKQQRDALQQQNSDLQEALNRLLEWVAPIAGDNRNPVAAKEEEESVNQARALLTKCGVKVC